MFFGDAGTDDLVFYFAVFEEQEKWDGLDVVFHSEVAGVVDIDLANFSFAFDFAGDGIDDGAEHFAWATPFCPEVDEDWHIGIDDLGLEVIFSEL